MLRGKVRVGYQGEVGSNSEEAARRLLAEHGIEDAELVGLVNSIHVISALEEGECDYGVVAVRNSYAGTVSETAAALQGAPMRSLGELKLPVSHCLYKLPQIPLEKIRIVASHPQAIAQTRQTRQAAFPAMTEYGTPDTAMSARWLREGLLASTTAVICSKRAGELYDLELVREGIQDSSENCTTFSLLVREGVDLRRFEIDQDQYR